jgi:hypothetical protein
MGTNYHALVITRYIFWMMMAHAPIRWIQAPVSTGL